MMLRYSFDMDKEANDIENAVEKALANGYRTTDLYVEGTKKLTCSEMGDIIIKNI